MNRISFNRLFKLRVTAKSFALFSIVSVIAVVVSDTGEDRSLSGYVSVFQLGVIITLLVAVIVFPLQWVIRKTPLTSKLSTFLLLLVIAFAGGARGYAFFELSESFGFDSVTSQSLRVFNSAVTTGIWLVFMSIAIQAQIEYRQQLEGLLRQAMMKKFAAISGDSLSREIGDIEQDLKALGNAQSGEAPDSALLLKAAQEVRTLISTSIRPLSHRLWLDTQSAIPRIKLKALFVDSIRGLDYSIHFVLAIYFFLSTVNLNSAVGIVDAVTRSLAGSITIFSVHLIFQRVSRRQSSRPLLASTIFLSLVGMTGALLTVLADQSWSISDFDFIYLLVVPYAPAIIILQSMARMVVNDRHQILTSLEESMRTGEMPVNSDETRYQTSQIASYLHNSLQSELTSIAIQLEAAAASENFDDSRRTMERLGALINRSISDDFANFYRTPTERIDHVVEAWRGILHISLSIPDECLQDNSRNILLVQYIEEVASNAVRFGEATEMHVDMKLLESGAVRMTISNNGSSSRVKAAGIGKQWLHKNSISIPRVSINSNGFELVVEL